VASLIQATTARPAQNLPRPDSATKLGFKDKLWRAAGNLRNTIESAEYKHVVLGLAERDPKARLQRQQPKESNVTAHRFVIMNPSFAAMFPCTSLADFPVGCIRDYHMHIPNSLGINYKITHSGNREKCVAHEQRERFSVILGVPALIIGEWIMDAHR
jgi:hypothetical protein